MIKDTRKTARRKILSPYFLILSSLLLAVSGIAMLHLCHRHITQLRGLTIQEIIFSGEMHSCVFLAFLYACLLGVFFFNAYEYCGTVEIREDCLVFKAPFHASIVFCYSEIRDLGIDYGVLSHGKQFWIYFSKEPIDKKYCHRINRLPFSATAMRIQYSSETFDYLVQEIPSKEIVKKLQRAHSIIKLYKNH